MSWVRYEDDYGPRVTLRFAWNEEAKDTLKASLQFPALKWDNERKGWSVRDNPQDLSCALSVLGEYGIHYDGLSVDDCAPPKANVSVEHKRDGLILKWRFQPNYRDINAALKSSAKARWNPKDKSWRIPFVAGPAAADAVEPHFAPLADAIRAVPGIAEAGEAIAQRIEYSSAVEADSIALKHLSPSRIDDVRSYQWVAPHMFSAGGQNRILIADGMGLGKSLQAILCVLNGRFSRTLIVCPSVVKVNWSNEIEKWTDKTWSIINGQSGEYEVGDFTIINYDILYHRSSQLIQDRYDCIIFDECHALKNPKSKRSIAAEQIVAEGCIGGLIHLSGTPILNRPIEAYPILKMLKPETFANKFLFGKKYCAAVNNGYGWDFNGASNIEHSSDGQTLPLMKLLMDVMLRRTMDDERLSEQMPSLIQNIIQIELDSVERTKYDSLFNSLMDEWDHYRVNEGTMPQGFVLNMMTELRHMAGRCKVRAALEWARDYHAITGKSLIIFAHHIDVLQALGQGIGAEHGYIDGQTTDKHRQRIIKEFQNGDYPFLIASTTAMKEGVNLDKADTTLFVERQWVPAWEQQAAARVRRMTQQSEICQQVIISAQNTIDGHFDKVVAGKAAIVEAALDGSEQIKHEIAEALAESLRSGEVVIQ